MTQAALKKKDLELKSICNFNGKGKKEFYDFYGIRY